MIETRSLIKSVHTTEGLLTILKGIDLRITEGEVVAIVGASGSGKSTLLGLMAGLDGASSGDVLLGGQNFSAMDELEDGKTLARVIVLSRSTLVVLDAERVAPFARLW